MPNVNEIRQSVQAIARLTSIHTFIQRDGITKTTFSYSGGAKNVKICQNQQTDFFHDDNTSSYFYAYEKAELNKASSITCEPKFITVPWKTASEFNKRDTAKIKWL
jgi:hypothetical protein